MQRRRARLLGAIRGYFERTGAWEVETPLLGRHGVTDPALDNLRVSVPVPSGPDQADLHLQTSPEYAMKRLLAAGSGSIFQICKAFRADESGTRHAPEFTLLEWYRVGADHHALMDDLEALLESVAGLRGCRRRRYAAVFSEHAGIDPLTASTADLAACAARRIAMHDGRWREDRALLQDLLFSHLIAPNLGRDVPEFVYDYPREQAALARLSACEPRTAERFELFMSGMEIANGFHELTDAAEQRKRFDADNARRRTLGRAEKAPDERLLAALRAGLPDCAGVALGLDRLLMVLCGKTRLSECVSFDLRRA